MQKAIQHLSHSHFHSSARAQCTRTYLLLFFSLMWSLVSRICPFLSHVIWGGGSPWATHVKMAVVPTGLEMDWGCCTNSAGAERRKEKEGKKSHDDPTLSLYKKPPHQQGLSAWECGILGQHTAQAAGNSGLDGVPVNNAKLPSGCPPWQSWLHRRCLKARSEVMES